MNPVTLDIVIAVASVAVFGAAYLVALVVTRPAKVTAAAATPDLGDEPPAVVNLLSNGWSVNEDASEATLLDLAARRIIELRQPDNDPRHTTIHLLEDPASHGGAAQGAGSGLAPYELRVLDRIQGLAVRGAIPVTALTFRNAQQAKTWNKRLTNEVILDARARGLSRKRFGPGVFSALMAVAFISAGGVALAHLHAILRDPEPDFGGVFAVWLVTFFMLGGTAAGSHGERDTAAGRQVAARWLGVQRWLRNHEEFADLPPAAVTVWDRYLPYGAALGVTHTASEVLDLGMGNRKLVWSSYGGGWHRVRVRYPKILRRYGASVPRLLGRAAAALVGGALLIYVARKVAEQDTSGQEWLLRPQEYLNNIGIPLGVLLVVLGGYLFTRTILDLVLTRTITGQVLWREDWRTKKVNDSNVVWLQYLAVDDGTSDRTRAWGLPTKIDSGGCRDGDTVRIVVRPWSRRITTVTVLERGRARQMNEVGPDAVLDPVSDVAKSLRAPSVQVDQLLTANEVSQALGLVVKPAEALATPMVSTAVFNTVDRNRNVLMLQLATGSFGNMAWRTNSRGSALPGIGDGAYHFGDRAVARVGDYTLVLTFVREGKGHNANVGWLLTQAAARLPSRTVEPA